MKGDRRHPSLVLLARPVHVEIAKADDGRRALGQHAPHVLVEQEFRVAVHVERRFVLALLAERRARAVHGCARRVQERNVVVLTMVEQVHRVPVVVAHHVAAIGLHRVRARALMQDRGDVVVEIAGAEPREKFFLVQVIGDLAIGEIAELVRARQIVDGDDVGLAASVEAAHEIRSHKAGGAGDDDVHFCTPRNPCPKLKVRGRCRPLRSSRAARAVRRRTAAHSRRSLRRSRCRPPAGPAPQHHGAADAGFGNIGQVDGDHVHRWPPARRTFFPHTSTGVPLGACRG